MAPTLHLLGLPHTQTTVEFCGCAYTSKALKAGKMFTDAGHRVVLYSGEQNEAVCAEHVPLMTEAKRRSWFGPWDPNRMPDVGWGANDPWWRRFNAQAIIEIGERAEPRDLLLLPTSWALKPVADAFPELLAVEYGVGYEGIALERVAFESYAWMHHVYGLRGIRDGRNFDAVIPNYFDPEEFPHLNDGEGDYLLFLGRVTPRKGVNAAVEVARHSGMRLLVAGPTEARSAVDQVDLSGEEHVEVVGPVGIEERAKLLAGARALLAPTAYIEPFGGVTIEALFAGTPAITTDFGAFTENLLEGETGFRFRTLAEGVAAVERAGDLDPKEIRARAMERFSLEAVAPLYTAWFERLASLWGRGWYELPAPPVAA